MELREASINLPPLFAVPKENSLPLIRKASLRISLCLCVSNVVGGQFR